MDRKSSFRPPAVAGSFYPADPEVLARNVERFVQGEPELPPPGPLGLLCPHAGYDYSGAVAGRAYREIRGRAPEVVVVLGPSHHDLFRGVTSWPGTGYRTPLGDLPHPPDLVEALEQAGPLFRRDPLGHREEHSVEVQLPFLQVVAPGVPALPLVVAESDGPRCREIGRALARTLAGLRVLLVASTDLYHGPSGEACRRTDAATLAALERNDPEELVAGFDSGTFQACGRGPILVVLEACRQLGARNVQVLARTNSDEVTGRDAGYVVGYAAVAVTRS